MRIFIATALAVAWLAGPAAASDRADVLAAAHNYVDALNKGDAKAMLAACDAQASIIDEFPPYHWQGATGCADWANDFGAFAQKNGITAPSVTLGKPRHVDITGDRAYVVVPASFAFTQKGKHVAQGGATWTVALRKAADGWRIAGWAWADR